MLTSTFQHIPGVGEKTEMRLWKSGCISWDRLLESDFRLSRERYTHLKAGVLESMGRLDCLDHRYFHDRLGKGIVWRAYNAFRDHACFLDIETTGLSPYHGMVTCVCVHSPKETKTYLAGDNMEELGRDLSQYKYLVTFNGARFDLPFLSASLGLKFDQIHLDLLYPLKALGYRGGLKKIESELGICRETAGVSGFDAVRLWHAYKNDRATEVAGFRLSGLDALDLLVRYNREDTENLEKLADYAVSELKKACLAP